MRTVTPRLPEWVERPLRRLRDVVKALPYRGKGRFCPVCGNSSRRFRQYGITPREDAQCAHCGAVERHRLCWLFLQKKTALFDGKPKRMLHVAPEPCFESRFKKSLGGGYLTADLFDRAMVKMDITDIQYSDQWFDVIYCSHVLEHVLNDNLAIKEFHRVLKNDGWAVLLVPITSESTFEDSSIIDPKRRLQAFGQEDHVRRYGPDYVNRLRDAGFKVEVFGAGDLVDQDEVVRMGLTPICGDIFYCTK